MLNISNLLAVNLKVLQHEEIMRESCTLVGFKILKLGWVHMVLLLPGRKEVEKAEIRGGGDSGCPASYASCLCPHPCLALGIH